MLNGENVLQTLIELLEHQEQIKITYTIKDQNRNEDDTQTRSGLFFEALQIIEDTKQKGSTGMLNIVAFTGRICNNLELKNTNNGTSVTTFNIAVDRKYQKSGEEKQTDFIPVVAWRSNAEFITKWFKKGDMVAISGALQSRKYTDKNGASRTAYEVIVENASFCGGKSLKKEEQTFEEVDDFSDLPF